MYSYLYPPTQQHSISSDKLLVPQSNDQRIEKRPPCIIPFPLCVEESLADISYRRPKRKASLGVEGLVEDHGEDGCASCHDACEDKGEYDLCHVR
jgi:hypothetical protein